MNVGSAGAMMTVERVLVVQLDEALTDGAVRQLRTAVREALQADALRGVAIDLASVEAMDSYLTRCIRDLAVSAQLMGVSTVVCGVQPAVADTLVEMGLGLGDIRTALNLDGALRILHGTRRARPGR